MKSHPPYRQACRTGKVFSLVAMEAPAGARLGCQFSIHGDVEIGDGNIYIGNSGEASNTLGVEWYKTAFPDWNVHEIKISTKHFPHQHLDCVMVASASGAAF